jgi:hypothetical protein
MLRRRHAAMSRISKEFAARCRRPNGTLRAWFATREEAEAFEADPQNVAYHGDVVVLCMKIGCDGYHLSRPDWPDAVAAAKARIN